MPNFGDAEVPSGAINGINTVYTLTNAPIPSTSLQLYKNGLEMRQGVDYTLVGLTITYTTAPQGATAQNGNQADSHIAFYRY